MIDIPKSPLCRVQCSLFDKCLSGAGLKALRKRYGIKQEVLARGIGFSMHYISAMERGKRAISYTTSHAIIRYFESLS